MKTRRLGAIGGCEARTQRLGRSRRLRARPRTTQRAAERGQAAECFVLIRVLSLWLPVVLWAALIFTLSSIPSLSSGLGFWDLILRKLAHAGEYALLSALLLRSLARPWPALVIAVAFAGSDELHQHFVRGRAGSPRDIAIDAAGAAVGLIVFAHWRRIAAKLGPARG